MNPVRITPFGGKLDIPEYGSLTFIIKTKNRILNYQLTCSEELGIIKTIFPYSLIAVEIILLLLLQYPGTEVIFLAWLTS